MNILYISCHAILEYEEIKIFRELGNEVFSLNGSYQNGENPAEADKRPGILGMKPDQHLLDLAMQSSRANIHEGFYEWADLIIVCHKIDWIEGDSGKVWLRNLVEKSKRYGFTIVWRGIGQSHNHWEGILKQFPEVKIVRYSPKEKNIPLYAGEDALIRFSVDRDEYSGWTGGDNRAHVFGQSLKERADFCGYAALETITHDVPRVMFGTKNSPSEAKKPEWAVDWAQGALSYDDLKQQYRKADVAVYAGSIPASYTLTFIEMMMTGTPMVCLGRFLFNMERHFPDHNLYEVSDIIQDGHNGFVSDDINYLNQQVKRLLRDSRLRQKISNNARQTGLELFDKEKQKDKWRQFLSLLPQKERNEN